MCRAAIPASRTETRRQHPPTAAPRPSARRHVATRAKEAAMATTCPRPRSTLALMASVLLTALPAMLFGQRAAAAVASGADERPGQGALIASRGAGFVP